YIDHNPIRGTLTGTFEFPQSYNWDVKGPGFNNWNYEVPETKKYRFRFRPAGYIIAGNNDGVYLLEVRRGSQIVETYASKYGSSVDFSNYFIDLDLIEGEVISFK